MYKHTAVPTPTLDVEIIQPEPYISGMLAELRCFINTDDAVDIPINVEVTWERNGAVINGTSSRVIPLPPRMLGSTSYGAILQFNTLSGSFDSGTYTCTSILSSSTNGSYTISTSESISYQLSVVGKSLWIEYLDIRADLYRIELLFFLHCLCYPS